MECVFILKSLSLCINILILIRKILLEILLAGILWWWNWNYLGGRKFECFNFAFRIVFECCNTELDDI